MVNLIWNNLCNKFKRELKKQDEMDKDKKGGVNPAL